MIITAATCLALNIFHESRGETLMGRMMVAQVTMNRVGSNRYPDTVCDVVYQDRKPDRNFNAQFSWVDDGKPDQPGDAEAWRDALFLAMDVLEDPSILPGSDATHFHTTASSPWWMDDLTLLGQVGSHRFYRE